LKPELLTTEAVVDSGENGVCALPAAQPSGRPIRFGVFELDAHSGELRKQGVKIKLQDQPFQILQVLLERPGELITREELQKRIWGADTFVDFEKGLYNAVKKLREALGDDPAAPGYIETVPKRGYRFIAPLNGDGLAGPTLVMPAPVDQISLAPGHILRKKTVAPAFFWTVLVAGLLVMGFFFAKEFPRIRSWVSNRGENSRDSLPSETRIAVLPFDVVGNNETVRVLADGIVETITSKLSQVEEFKGKLMVVAASEVRTRRLTSVEQARNVYGVNLAMTGSAQQWGNRIQFTLNLVDTATLRQTDSRTFEFDGTNPIAIRDEVTNGALRMLHLKLTPEESRQISEGETSTPAAYAEYLKGIGYLARYDVSGNVDHAIESLSAAVQLDPNYALAFASLGRAQWLKARIDNDAQEKEVAIKSISESIRLAPGLAEGHVSLGEIDADTGRTAEAIEEERSALRISPDNAQAYRVLGETYARSGQYDQAEAQYREAIRRQPSNWYGYLLLGLFYSSRGRIADARNEYELALKFTPNNELLYRDLSALDLKEGNFRAASDRIAKATQFEPVARTYLTLGMAYYYQRRYAEAAAALNSGIALDANLYSLWVDLGEVYLHLPGSQQKAKESFRKAITLAEKHLATVQSDDSTHANLAEYWATLGRKDKAEKEINKIPEQSRNTFADRLVPTYELLGDRHRAVQMVQSLRPDDPLLIFIKNDPDLELLWRDPALRPTR